MEDCGVLSPLSPGSLVPAVATVEMDSAVICRGNADTASSNMYAVVPSQADMWLDPELAPGGTTRPPLSTPGSVPDDITDADVDNCSFELLEPTAISARQSDVRRAYGPSDSVYITRSFRSIHSIYML